MPHASLPRTLLLSLLLAVVTSPLIFDDPPKTERPAVAVGALDYAIFWSGIQAFIRGENPYDLRVLLAIQKEVFPERDAAKPFLNPPWSFPLLLPVMFLPFEYCRVFWLALNLIFWAAMLVPLGRIYGWSFRQSPWRLAAAAIFFVPVLQNVYYGQLSLLVALSITSSVAAFSLRRDRCAALLLLPAVLKPQLMYLIFLLIAAQALRERRTGFLAVWLLGFLLMAAVPICLAPRVYAQWWSAELDAVQWRSSSLPTVVRSLLLTSTGSLPSWPVMLFPLAACVACLFWYLRRPAALNWRLILPPLLCLSLIAAPYAWPFDYSLLLVVQIAAMGALYPRLSPERRRNLLLLLILSQFSFPLVSAYTDSLEHFVYFPVLSWCIWVYATAAVKHAIQTGRQAPRPAS